MDYDRERIQEAVNQMAGALRRINTLEAALKSAYTQLALINEAVSPHAYRVPYEHATPIKYTSLVDEAQLAIEKALKGV